MTKASVASHLSHSTHDTDRSPSVHSELAALEGMACTRCRKPQAASSPASSSAGKSAEPCLVEVQQMRHCAIAEGRMLLNHLFDRLATALLITAAYVSVGNTPSCAAPRTNGTIELIETANPSSLSPCWARTRTDRCRPILCLH